MSYQDRVTAAIDRIRAQREESAALTGELHTAEELLAQAIEGLLPAPVDGEEWNGTLNYITGTVAAWKGTDYIALKYSRGKQPDISPAHWAVYVLPAETLYWAELESGHAFTGGDRVEHNGMIWVCTKAHTKSQVRVPLDGSQYWERA